jgi:hypothetical protein
VRLLILNANLREKVSARALPMKKRTPRLAGFVRYLSSRYWMMSGMGIPRSQNRMGMGKSSRCDPDDNSCRAASFLSPLPDRNEGSLKFLSFINNGESHGYFLERH